MGVEYTLSFKAGSWKDKGSTLKLSATGAGTSLSKNSITLANEKFNNYSATFTASESSVSITFTSDKDNAFFSKELATIYKDIKFDLTFEDLKRKERL